MRLRCALSTAAALVGARLRCARIPLAVSLSITDRCNAQCAYCGIWRSPLEEIDTESLESLIDDLARSGTRRLTFTGGEPLVRQDAARLIAYASRRGIFTGLNTNGLLMRTRLPELKGLDYVKISYDGPREIHRAQRAGSYDHGEILEGAKAARAAGIKVALNATLTKYNVDLIPEILKTAGSLELTADFNCLSPHDRAGPDLDEIAPAPEALSKAFAYLASEARNPAVSCSPAYIRFVLGQLGAEGAPKRRPVCRAGRLFCYIDTSGDVYPCFDMRGQGRYGNAVRDGVIPALRRIPLMACPRCYCSAAIELNLLAAGTPDSLMNLRKWI